jgi:hypothetical protein
MKDRVMTTAMFELGPATRGKNTTARLLHSDGSITIYKQVEEACLWQDWVVIQFRDEGDKLKRAAFPATAVKDATVTIPEKEKP